LLRFIKSVEGKAVLYTLSVSEKHARELKTYVVDIRKETAARTQYRNIRNKGF